MAGRYGESQVPALVCWGARDTWIPVGKGREPVSRIPGARPAVVEGAGHLVQEDAPAELARFVGTGDG